MLNLKEFVEKNPKLITRKESKRHPGLYVLKYRNKVFYDNLWSPELMEMRGTIVDKDWKIIVYPFTKIFNRFENNTDINRDEEVVAVQKINGFMAAVTYDTTYGFIISTTGSTDSPFVDLAAKYVGFLKDQPIVPNVTFLFEICDPADLHIIPEESGAYLIGARSTGSGKMYREEYLDNTARLLNLKRPDWKKCRFSDIVNEAKNCRHEGFVVYGSDVVLKIKSPYYLFKKFVARSAKTDKLLDPNIKQSFDEEYYPLIDHIQANIEQFTALDEQARLTYVRNFLEAN